MIEIEHGLKSEKSPANGGAIFSPKPVLICMGRFGDLYQVCKAAVEPSIIVTSPEFSQIVRELFPQHELFLIDRKITTMDEAVIIAETRFPGYDIRPCQQHLMPVDIQRDFRNYQAFQEFQAGDRIDKPYQNDYQDQFRGFNKAVIYLSGVSSAIQFYSVVKRNIIQGLRSAGIPFVEYENQMESFKKLRDDFNQPYTLYIVNDTLEYHLCDNAPVILISRAIQWAQSSPKPNCIGRLTPEMLEMDYSELLAIIYRGKSMRQFYDHHAAKTIILFNEHVPSTSEAFGRYANAAISWVGITEFDYHVELQAETTEGLPFVNHLLKNGLERCEHPDDILIFLNRDICLVPESVGMIRAFMDSRNIDACYIHRVNCETDKPLRYSHIKHLPHDWGIDVFCFRMGSEAAQKLLDVSLYIGRTDWDNYWASVVKVRFPYNVAYHQPHEGEWKSGIGLLSQDENLRSQNQHNQQEIWKFAPKSDRVDKGGFGIGPIT